MKKFSKLILVIVLGAIGMTQAFGQTTLSVNGQTLSEHGYNSGGTATALEATDSVTVGSTMNYYAIPDPTANASYTGVLTGSLTSQFNWRTNGGSGGAGTIAPVAGFAAFTNYKAVNWTTVGTINLLVNERSPAGCSDTLNTKTIPVSVVAVPTANFGTDPAAQCYSSGIVTFSLPITVTTPINNGSVRVIYTVFNSSNVAVSAGLTNVTANITGSTNLSVALPAGTAAGAYHATISSITDRISRKPATPVQGTFGVGNDQILMVINAIPVTGNVYHIANQ